ncbi:MAG: hypothetical protein ACTSU2_15350 [Promethearchaeota archaeon]
MLVSEEIIKRDSRYIELEEVYIYHEEGKRNNTETNEKGEDLVETSSVYKLPKVFLEFSSNIDFEKEFIVSYNETYSLINIVLTSLEN